MVWDVKKFIAVGFFLSAVFHFSCVKDPGEVNPVDRSPDSMTTTVQKNLKLHIINVQWGDSILIEGPDGTTVLIDGGSALSGMNDVVPYLRENEIPDTLDYMIVTHKHGDHYQGLIHIMGDGFDALNILDNGSNETYDPVFYDAANRTSSQGIRAIEVGQVIELGDQAKITCVAANGQVINHGQVDRVTTENDRSVCLLLQYGAFDCLLMGDAGGGYDPDVGHCRRTADIETALINVLIFGDADVSIPENGIEILKVGHHGDFGSTNSYFMNSLSPMISCISVGENVPQGFDLPHVAVVDTVLLAGSSAIKVPPTIVLQTDEGDSRFATSFSGYCVGDIVVCTDGKEIFEIYGTGRLRYGTVDERTRAGIPRSISLK